MIDERTERAFPPNRSRKWLLFLLFVSLLIAVFFWSRNPESKPEPQPTAKPTVEASQTPVPTPQQTAVAPSVKPSPVPTKTPPSQPSPTLVKKEPPARPTAAPKKAVRETVKAHAIPAQAKGKKERPKKPSLEPLRKEYARMSPSAFRRVREPLLHAREEAGDREDLGLMIAEVNAYLGSREKNSEWVASAKKEALKWEKANPKDPRGPRAVAWAYWASAEVVPATLFAKKALESKPGDPIARMILGSAIYKTGNQTEGLSVLKDVYAKYPEMFPVGEALTQVYLQRGQYSDAEPIVKKLESLEPGDSIVEDLLAETLEGEGKWQEAIQRYEPVVRKNPERYDLKLLLVQAYRRTDHFTEARRHLNDLVAAQEAGKLKLTREREVIYCQERGKLAFDQGQYSKSIVHFEKALQLDPSNSATLKYLAGAQFREKNYKAAAATYEKAVQADPDDLSTRQYQGMALFESGQLGKAETAFRDVQKRGSETALAYFYLARIAQARGKIPEAVTMCEKALQIDPQHTGAAELLKKLKAAPQPAPH